MSCDPSQPTLPLKLKGQFHQASHVTLNQRFRMCGLREQHPDYNLYQGIDIQKSKWVNIYIKLVLTQYTVQKSSNFQFSKQIKENSRNVICPKVIQTGDVEILKYKYSYEVHQRFGPSLDCLFGKVKERVTYKQLLHLLFEMLKLIQRLDNLRMVSGELTPACIIFDLSPRKNDLYLLNSFTLKKRNQEKKSIHTRYCSRGAHLGRNISIKDDLQSVCYILIDIYTQGNFLNDKEIHEYKLEKLSLKIEQFASGLPQTFVDFYYYVINLNYTDDINYFYWKTYLTKLLTLDVITHPYSFLLAKATSSQPYKKSNEGENQIDDLMETFQDDGYNQKEDNFTKVERIFKNNEKFRL